MKKETKIHEFDPVIYPRNVWISIKPNIDALKEQFEFSSADEEYYRSEAQRDHTAIGFKVIKRSNRFQGILMAFKSVNTITFKTVAHESVHIADYIFEEIGAYSQDFREKNEPYAYLVGWVADCIEKVKLNKE